MFIAHLPAGYLLADPLARRLAPPNATRRHARALLLAGLAASVAPDLDLLWFFFVDGRSVHHHRYATHLPLAWAALGLAAALLARRLLPAALPFIAVITAGGLLHLLLDTMTGEIRWLWPLTSEGFHLLTVRPGHAFWVWNFILHPSFAVEILICAAAGLRLSSRLRAVAEAREAQAARPVSTASAQSSRPAARAAAAMRDGS